MILLTVPRFEGLGNRYVQHERPEPLREHPLHHGIVRVLCQHSRFDPARVACLRVPAEFQQPRHRDALPQPQALVVHPPQGVVQRRPPPFVLGIRVGALAHEEADDRREAHRARDVQRRATLHAPRERPGELGAALNQEAGDGFRPEADGDLERRHAAQAPHVRRLEEPGDLELMEPCETGGGFEIGLLGEGQLRGAQKTESRGP